LEEIGIKFSRYGIIQFGYSDEGSFE